jgi:hypothetical protein
MYLSAGLGYNNNINERCSKACMSMSCSRSTQFASAQIFNSLSGVLDGQDAPDIVANTFLDQVNEEQMEAIGYGFLSHREGMCHWQLSQASLTK